MKLLNDLFVAISNDNVQFTGCNPMVEKQINDLLTSLVIRVENEEG